MSPTLSMLALEGQSDEHFVHTISNLLSPSECARISEQHEQSLIPIGTSYTARLRHIFVDEDLASTLWDRLKPFYGNMRVVDEEKSSWKASHLNTWFRFCKYRPGDAFGPHTDGRRLTSVNTQSFMTVNIYLNTVSAHEGGATRILAPSAHKVLAEVRPIQGSASVFRDSLFHDGEQLRSGIKYLLRTDIMFAREETFDFNTLHADLSDEEKGAKALKIAELLEDGGNRDEAVVWYKRAFRLNPRLEGRG